MFRFLFQVGKSIEHYKDHKCNELFRLFCIREEFNLFIIKADFRFDAKKKEDEICFTVSTRKEP